jgi:hypothetical protein
MGHRARDATLFGTCNDDDTWQQRHFIFISQKGK